VQCSEANAITLSADHDPNCSAETLSETMAIPARYVSKTHLQHEHHASMKELGGQNEPGLPGSQVVNVNYVSPRFGRALLLRLAFLDRCLKVGFYAFAINL